MSVIAFLSHVADASPTFKCYACGDRDEALSLVACLTHDIGDPATPAALEQLRNWLGPCADAFIELYAQHNGYTLYQDTRGDAQGVRLFSIEDWKDQTEEMKAQYEAMGLGPDEQPVAVPNALAFAEIPHSANYFTVKLSGPDAGKIYYADHDDFSGDPFAESLNDFLDRIVADPAQFLYDVGCYTRYSDGTSSTQWIPKQYAGNTPV